MKRTLLALLALAGCGPQDKLAGYEHPQMVTRAELGDKWPFTVDTVIVHCEKDIYYLVSIPNGGTFALNGSASSVRGDDGERKYRQLEDIWQHDKTLGGNWRISIEPILEIARRNCEGK